jgi:hypothetical protein
MLAVSVHHDLGQRQFRERRRRRSISRNHVWTRLLAEFEIVSDQSKVSHAARKRQNTQSTRYTVAPLSLAWFGVLKEKTVVYILRYFLLFADASTC